MRTQKQFEVSRLTGPRACIIAEGKDKSKLIGIANRSCLTDEMSKPRSTSPRHAMHCQARSERQYFRRVEHLRDPTSGKNKDSNRSSNEPETDLIALYSTLALAEQTYTDSSASSHL